MDQRWTEFMRHNHLECFDDVWLLPEDWIDEPNRGRGGWSGVSRHELKSSGGAIVPVILKRQEDYVKRTWLHPLRGVATLRAEAAMIERLRARGIAVPELIYFGESARSRAALMTVELESSEPLDRFARMLQIRQAPLAAKRELVFVVAQAVRKLHLARCQHRALFPKHLLVCGGHPLRVFIIDFEKARMRLFVHSCTVRDLDELNRRSHGLSLSDRMRFFKHYCNVSRLGAREKFLWRWIARRGARKQSKHARQLKAPENRVNG